MSDPKYHVLTDQQQVDWALRWFMDLPRDSSGCRIGWTLNEGQSHVFRCHYPDPPIKERKGDTLKVRLP